MNDLRRLLLWLAVLGVLGIGVWGFNKNEVASARPNDPVNRSFRAAHKVQILGRDYFLPLRRMLLSWGAVVLAAASLWPVATDARARRTFGSWERPPGI
jgi:hypothetical protein